MSGYRSVAGWGAILLGMVALVAPAPAGAQTAAQRAREQEIRARMEENRARMEERLQAVQEAQLAQNRARLRQVEERLQQLRQDRMVQLEEALAQARQAAGEAGALSQERLEAVRARLRATGDQLRTAQEVVLRLQTRVRLGVSLDASQGAEYDRQGARIEGVLEDSPAQEAGLREGDVITRLDGHSLLEPLSDEEERDFDLDESLPVQRLMALARELEPGEEVELQYLRDGSAHTATFEAADLEEPTIAVFPGGEGRIRIFRDSLRSIRIPELENLRDSLRIVLPRVYTDSLPMRGFLWGVTPRAEGEPLVFNLREGAGLRVGWSVHGLELAPMNPGLGEYFSTDKGVLVLDVAEGSQLGLEPGDVLLSIDGRIVSDPSDVRRILASYEAGESVSFTVMRNGREVTVTGEG